MPNDEKRNRFGLVVPKELSVPDQVLDRLRGSPFKRLTDLANDLDISLEQLLEMMHTFIDSDGQEYFYHPTDAGRWDGSIDFPLEAWDWFELVTRRAVPAGIRKQALEFACSC